MKEKYIHLILFGLMLSNIINAQTNKLITIENQFIKAGFLPDVGGRMVYLAYIGCENVLHTDTALWNEDESKRVNPHPGAGFKAYNGHITWLGPQSDWWKQQDLMPQKRDRGDLWPPDPYLIYSIFEIIENTDTSIVLQGNKSPVSGVRLTKNTHCMKTNLKLK